MTNRPDANELEDLRRNDIDFTTFEQILEMDDDDNREFSRTIVFEFFQQAETTFHEMEEKIAKGDLLQLSSLGHFLKGSSATLGLYKLKNACESIQNLGVGKDNNGNAHGLSNQQTLDKIQTILLTMKSDYTEVSGALKRFYGPDSS